MSEDRTFLERFTMSEPRRFDRRSFLGRALALGLSAPLVTGLLAACGDDDDDDSDGDGQQPPAATNTPATTESPTAAAGTTATTASGETPAAETPAGEDGEGVRGGTLKVALIGEPPTLDIHQTTATIVSMVTWHMYESLFTWDADFQVIPLLAEALEVSSDGLTNTLSLRQGVPFHNGEEMKAADVIASLERWGTISGLGKNLVEATAETNEIDEYTIEYVMKAPYGTFNVVLARQNQGAAIYPKSIVDAAGEEPLTEYVGTGPYKFVEHQPDRFIRFERFDDYAQPGDAPNGYGGLKAQWVDEIEFSPVPDEAARVAALQAGDYHYLESISTDQYEALKDDSSVSVTIGGGDGWDILVFNTKAGILTDLKLRQAIQAAIEVEPILIAANGEGFYRVDPSIMLSETAWHSTKGEELYNQANPELAKQLLTEAGYDGTPIRFMTTQEYLDQYNMGVVSTQQLEEAGFTIDLQIYDWATVVERRGDETLWDIFTTGIAFRVDPVTLPFLQGCGWPGWWCTDPKVAAVGDLQGEAEFEARLTAFEQVQQLFYDEVPAIKIGDTLALEAKSPSLKGPILQQLSPEFVNAWIEE